MNILIDNKEIKNFSKTNGANCLSCKEITEVHAGIILIKTLDNQTYIKENKGNSSKPIVEFNVLVGDTLHKGVKFVAEQTDKKSKLNYKTLGIVEEQPKQVHHKIHRVSTLAPIHTINENVVTEQVESNKFTVNCESFVDEIRSGNINLLIDSRPIDKFAKTTSANTFICKEYTEVYNDVYLIKTHDNHTYLKDIKGKHRGDIVVEFNVQMGDNLYKGVKFVLEKSNELKVSRINFKNLGFDKFILTDLPTQLPVSENTDTDVISVPQPETVHNVTMAAPVSVAPTNQLTPDQIKEQVTLAIAEMLQGEGEITEKLAKLVSIHTESVRKDMMRYADQVSKREMLRAMESGGGSNATQYANGGVINGNLTVTGTISATNIEGGGGGGGGSTLNKKAFMIGDGVNSDYQIIHNYGSRNIIVDVYDTTTNERIDVLITNDDPNYSTVRFSHPIGINSYTVVTLG